MIKNPVMFCVEIGMIVMIAVILFGEHKYFGFDLAVTLILFITILFANFAEAIAEARGKAQAETLRKTRHDTPARQRLNDGSIREIRSSDLNKGDEFICEANDIIPIDGEIIEGMATIDESAITGESAPVIREAGTDHSGVIGGTRVLSDRIVVKVTTEPGESFLDKMISLVEGASRQKTPNEIALTIILVSFTIVFLLVVVTLDIMSGYVHAELSIAAMVALFVCLIPTTIGGLLSAIGIAGMDRALRANVMAKSGKAVETAGDIDTLLLDKTGTITIGNRKATNFYPHEMESSEFARFCLISSLSDSTPEGKSIVELARQQKVDFTDGQMKNAEFIPFTAETRSSGVDLPDGTKVRKGALDAIRTLASDNGFEFPGTLEERANEIARNGGTPLVVVVNRKTCRGYTARRHSQTGYYATLRTPASHGAQDGNGDRR